MQIKNINLANRIKSKKLRLRNKIYTIKEEKRFASEKWTHITYCAVGNAGDTCLSQCVRRTFNTNSFNNGWIIKAVNEPVTDELINTINSSKALIIGGGGLFLPDTNKNNISGWQWAVPTEQYKNIQVPIFVFSVGYNYFRNQTPSKLFIDNLIQLCSRADFIGLRNNGSVRAVKKLLPEDLKEKIVYQPCTTTLIRKLYTNLPPKRYDSKNICINMAFDRSELRFSDKKEDILNAVAQAVETIYKKGYKIHFAAHMKSDLEFIPYLEKLNIPVEIHKAQNLKPKQLIEFYNNMDLVMGMRGHAQMIPFGVNCEIISLSTHEKMKWFLEDIDSPDWCVELNSDIDTLTQRITDTFISVHETNAELTQKRLIQAQEKLWNITLDNLNTLKGYF